MHSRLEEKELIVLSKLVKCERVVDGDYIRKETGFSSQEVNDAIEVLEEYVYVEVWKTCETRPFNFKEVKCTAEAFLIVKSELDYDPEEDMKKVAAVVVSVGDSVRGDDLKRKTGLSVERINRAVELLDNRNLIDVYSPRGTEPYRFEIITPTAKTRKYVKSYS